MRQLPTAGGMLVVWAEPTRVRTLLEPWQQVLDMAAINGPRQTVVAGAAEALAQLQQQLDTQQIRYQTLGTTHAFHSPLVEPMLAAFAEVAQQIRYAPPQLPYFSSTLGRRAGDEVAQAAYWQQHLRQSVRFHEAASGLLADKPTAVLEVGAGSTLVSLLRSGFRQQDLRLLKGLSGSGAEWPEHLQQLGQLYVLGAPLDWRSVWSDPQRHIARRKISLPTYPFETQRYWFATAEPASQPVATGARGPSIPCWVTAWNWRGARLSTRRVCEPTRTCRIIASAPGSCCRPAATWNWPWRRARTRASSCSTCAT